ncbi:DUF89 family protein [Sedimentibacter sp. zth1]|uniref:damage-control phosphatase ARMT1 family protein n=1 Tax=Sedimentibacter sp. zth1 TaxID=2816908 RepID=UPI001A9230A2|nr:ARMT1-like domain-containing protein [Sedimentibacter sp. zth1]QSX06298.1 DUF89 family protein [Sedimentibacter sp. zth1]
MKITYDCLICLSRQITKVATMSTKNIEIQQNIIRNLYKKLGDVTFQETSPELNRIFNKYVIDELNLDDPYKQIKDDCNKFAFKLCETYKLEEMINKSTSPIETACRIAIAGNIIDFSAHDYITKELVTKTLETCITDRLFGNDVENFIKHLQSSNKILYLADNAGEIVFDKLFISKLPKNKITYVVKKEPIVNDATIKDALDVKINDLVRVIDNGSDAQGTIMSLCSQEFIKEFEDADLIIAKGQANYETLSEVKDKNIFYLFKAKCNSVAKDIGCNVGDLVMKMI